MSRLDIRIESYSDSDLGSVGVYRYTDDPSFLPLLFGYSLNGMDATVVDLTENDIPPHIIDAILDTNVVKTAWDTQTDRVRLTGYLRNRGVLGVDEWLDPNGWECVMVHSMQLGKPIDLGLCAEALDIHVEDGDGAELMRLFTKPKRKTPSSEPSKWEKFKHQCIEKVHLCTIVHTKLNDILIQTESERDTFVIDQRINDRGVQIDDTLVSSAIYLDKKYKIKNNRRMSQLTGCTNPNSPKQLTEWLKSNGINVPNLRRETVDALIGSVGGDIREVLELRIETQNQSIAKYSTMRDTVCDDGRIRGLLQFHGAQRTGRWSGRLAQVQNLPKNDIDPLDDIRECIREKDGDILEMIFGSVPNVLKHAIRTAIIAEKGKAFVISDFASIEARVLAWLADETWVLDVFRTDGKIYEAAASRMYDIPVENVSDSQRSKGKVATLALGYQGSVGALKAMGADMTDEEMRNVVSDWRQANPSIVQFWYRIGDAAKRVIQKGGVAMVGRIGLHTEDGCLFISLPSGRKLAYPNADITASAYGEKITYEAYGSSKRTEDTYGGKLVENIVQAVARDALAESIVRIDKDGYNVVMHVHDEVVVECDASDIHDVDALMKRAPHWADGLPIDTESFVSNYYRKK